MIVELLSLETPRSVVGIVLANEAAMDIQIFRPDELHCVLRALRYVARAERLSDGERALLEGIAHIHEQELRAELLQPIACAEVARAVVDPQRRKRLVQLAIVMSLVEGAPSPAAARRVSELAHALAQKEEGLSVLNELSRGQLFHARVHRGGLRVRVTDRRLPYRSAKKE